MEQSPAKELLPRQSGQVGGEGPSGPATSSPGREHHAVWRVVCCRGIGRTEGSPEMGIWLHDSDLLQVFTCVSDEHVWTLLEVKWCQRQTDKQGCTTKQPRRKQLHVYHLQGVIEAHRHRHSWQQYCTQVYRRHTSQVGWKHRLILRLTPTMSSASWDHSHLQYKYFLHISP